MSITFITIVIIIIIIDWYKTKATFQQPDASPKQAFFINSLCFNGVMRNFAETDCEYGT